MNKVGTPTGIVLKSGRPLIKTKKGEFVSEKSVTILLDNGKWINIPSIHNNKKYTEEQLKKAVQEKRLIPTSTHNSKEEAIKFAIKRSKSLFKVKK